MSRSGVGVMALGGHIHLQAWNLPAVFHEARYVGGGEVAHHGQGQGSLVHEMALHLGDRYIQWLVQLQLRGEVADYLMAHGLAKLRAFLAVQSLLAFGAAPFGTEMWAHFLEIGMHYK